MTRIARIFKHRWLDETDSHRALNPAALARLQARIAASEGTHSGQIRIAVEAGLPLSYLWRNASARDRAITLFGKLRVWDTERNNGVLIYLLLAEHRIEIVADRGLNQQVSTGQWSQLAHTMSQAFQAGQFEAGLNQAVDAVGALLSTHFPAEAGANLRPNELPDAPVLL